MGIASSAAPGSGPCFHIIEDDAALRAHLARRVEVKYPFPGGDIGKLRSVLASNCRRVAYNEAVSTVRSVYFDDGLMSACRANLDGVGSRRKVRIRWYDSRRPGDRVFFEIKWRSRRVTGKDRVPLLAETCLADLSYKQVVAGLRTTLPSQYLEALVAFPEATVLVEYKREHFISRDGLLRATLDYNVAYYDQFGKAFMSSSFGARVDDLVIVEVKAPLGRESDSAELLYPLSPRAGRCSKYVLGCKTLGLISSWA